MIEIGLLKLQFTKNLHDIYLEYKFLILDIVWVNRCGKTHKQVSKNGKIPFWNCCNINGDVGKKILKFATSKFTEFKSNKIWQVSPKMIFEDLVSKDNPKYVKFEHTLTEKDGEQYVSYDFYILEDTPVNPLVRDLMWHLNFF